MKRETGQSQKGLEALPGTGALLGRLKDVRRRKRAYGGQAVDMEALRRRIERENERRRDR